MTSRSPHRGHPGASAEFAAEFIAGRLRGFDKDMGICLTAAPSPTGRGTTHAYFPALATCCSTLEYLTSLFKGRLDGMGWQQVDEFAARFLPQPDYDRQTIRVLFSALRNPVAHRGVATGVWVDRAPDGGRRRLTWKVSVGAKRPACQVIEEAGRLIKDPPWPSGYTHRVHVHLRGLWLDIRSAAIAYSTEVPNDHRLLANFQECMKQLYPM